PAEGVDEDVVRERLHEDGAAAGAQHPPYLVHGRVEVEVVQDPGAADQVEGAVVEAEVLRIHLLEARAAAKAEARRLAPRIVDRDLRNVDRGDAAALPREPEGRGVLAAAELEHAGAGRLEVEQ